MACRGSAVRIRLAPFNFPSQDKGSGLKPSPADTAYADTFYRVLHTLLHTPVPAADRHPAWTGTLREALRHERCRGWSVAESLGQVRLTRRDLTGTRSTVTLPISWERGCVSAVIAAVATLRDRMELRGLSLPAAAELLAAALLKAQPKSKGEHESMPAADFYELFRPTSKALGFLLAGAQRHLKRWLKRSAIDLLNDFANERQEMPSTLTRARDPYRLPINFRVETQ